MSKKIQLKIRSEYFKKIAEGKKTVEGRLNKPDLSSLRPGDEIEFVADNQTLQVCVTYTKTFSSFTDMLGDQGIEKCLPGVVDLEEGTRIYRSFPGYEEQEKKLGVLAIGIRALPWQL